jgi:hypothetical protein
MQDIDHSAHGRLAWMALQAHCQGECFMNKQKEKAYPVLDAVCCKGKWSNFTFKHFTNILTKAHNNLSASWFTHN